MIILFITYSILMACLQVAIKNDWKIGNYQIFHAFGLVLNIFVICGLIWLPKPENVYIFILTACTIYWIAFDISYNILNGEKPFHIGGGMSDKLGIIQFPIKLILLIIVIFL